MNKLSDKVKNLLDKKGLSYQIGDMSCDDYVDFLFDNMKIIAYNISGENYIASGECNMPAAIFMAHEIEFPGAPRIQSGNSIPWRCVSIWMTQDAVEEGANFAHEFLKMVDVYFALPATYDRMKLLSSGVDA